MAPHPSFNGNHSTDFIMDVDENLNYLQYILSLDGNVIDDLFDLVPQSLVPFHFTFYFFFIFYLFLF